MNKTLNDQFAKLDTTIDNQLATMLAASVTIISLRKENQNLRAQVKELTAQNWRLSSLERERNDWQPERGDLT